LILPRSGKQVVLVQETLGTGKNAMVFYRLQGREDDDFLMPDGKTFGSWATAKDWSHPAEASQAEKLEIHTDIAVFCKVHSWESRGR